VTFGAFVEILDGVEGLVHISELAAHHVENPREIVQPGDELRVKILEIDSERRRLSLSAKRVEGQVLPVRRIEPEGEEGETAEDAQAPEGSDAVAEVATEPLDAVEVAEQPAEAETPAEADDAVEVAEQPADAEAPAAEGGSEVAEPEAEAQAPPAGTETAEAAAPAEPQLDAVPDAADGSAEQPSTAAE
jgi:small subunit ribosomal protein S1